MKILRFLANVLHFNKRCLGKCDSQFSTLTASEIEDTLHLCARETQRERLSEVYKSISCNRESHSAIKAAVRTPIVDNYPRVQLGSPSFSKTGVQNTIIPALHPQSS